MRRIYKFNAKIYWLAPLGQAPISELHFTSFQSKYPVLITVCFQFEVVSASFQKTSWEKKADEVDLFTMHMKSFCQSLKSPFKAHNSRAINIVFYLQFTLFDVVLALFQKMPEALYIEQDVISQQFYTYF